MKNEIFSSEYKQNNAHLTNINNDDKFPDNSLFCDISKSYINTVFICDNEENCPINDNKNLQYFCSKDKETKFKCYNSSQTIHFFQICNYVNDCEDKSDELNCGKLIKKI